MTVTESTSPEEPRISVTEHGPYRVEGAVAIYDTEGNLVRHGGSWCLCRCGGSRHKPFCDVTHAVKGFVGTETASHDTISERRRDYRADGLTIYDDRSRCAHFGQCTTSPARGVPSRAALDHPHRRRRLPGAGHDPRGER